MATVTVRNLPAEIHRAIRVRAAEHGRSAEAEIREILAQAVQSDGRLRLGTELSLYAEHFGALGTVQKQPKQARGRPETTKYAKVAKNSKFSCVY